MIWNKYFHCRKSILICHKMNNPKVLDHLGKGLGRCLWLGRKISNGKKSSKIWWGETI